MDTPLIEVRLDGAAIALRSIHQCFAGDDLRGSEVAFGQ